MTGQEEKELKKRLDRLESASHPSPPSQSEIERRLTAIEKSVSDFGTRMFDGHKWFVTILFSAVAIMLTFFGIFSRLDVKDSTAEMERRVEEKTKEMDSKFAALAGDALKKPALEILHDNSPLENQTIDMIAHSNQNPVTSLLNKLFLKNTGEKRTEPLSIRISIAAEAFDIYYEKQDWERVPSFDKAYSVSFLSTRQMTVAAGQTLNIQDLEFAFDYSASRLVTNTPCKIEVFYGGEKPAEAKFNLGLILR